MTVCFEVQDMDHHMVGAHAKLTRQTSATLWVQRIPADKRLTATARCAEADAKHAHVLAWANDLLAPPQPEADRKPPAREHQRPVAAGEPQPCRTGLRLGLVLPDPRSTAQAVTR